MEDNKVRKNERSVTAGSRDHPGPLESGHRLSVLPLSASLEDRRTNVVVCAMDADCRRRHVVGAMSGDDRAAAAEISLHSTEPASS